MSLFDSFRKLISSVDKLDSSVYSGNQSLLEVYERNRRLEAEIAARTQELATANKQMLTLQHVWDMMNSSKPLSSVLNAIATSLQGEFGYLNTCITKHFIDENGEYLQLISACGELFGYGFLKFFNCEPSELRLDFPKDEEIRNAINTNTIYQSTDIQSLIKTVVPNAPELIIRALAQHSKAKSYIMVPLAHKNSHFGCLVLFSSREVATASEIGNLPSENRTVNYSIDTNAKTVSVSAEGSATVSKATLPDSINYVK